MTLTKTQRGNRTAALIVLVIALLLLVPCVVYLHNAPMHTEYTYSVKTEQVYDNGKISESTPFDELSADEQKILFDAFKNSEGFLHGASVDVSKREKLDTFDGWKIIEFQGVYLLTAIDGPHEEEVYDSDTPIAVWLLSTLLVSIVLVALWNVIFPPRW